MKKWRCQAECATEQYKCHKLKGNNHNSHAIHPLGSVCTHTKTCILRSACIGAGTFDLWVSFLPPLGQKGADPSVASVPEVLDGQGDPTTREEVAQTVTAHKHAHT